MKLTHSLIIALLLLWPMTAHSQFRHFTMAEGLPSNTIHGLFQDSDGFIWAGTSSGLSYHNGRRFVPIESIPGKAVYSICEPFQDGNLWVGTSEGVYKVNRESRTSEPIPITIDGRTLSELSAFRIVSDADHSVWVGSYGSGMFRYSPETDSWKHYKTVGKGVRYILTGIDKSVWVCAGDPYLYRYNTAKDDFDTIQVKDKFSSEPMVGAVCSCQDSNGDIWVCSVDAKLFKLSLIDMQSVMISFSFPEETITPRAIVERSPGELVIGTNSGLISFNTREMSLSRLDKGTRNHNGMLNDRFVHSLLKDIDGGLWIGTFFGGVNYITSGTNSISTIYPGIDCGNIISVMSETGDDTVLIGSDDGGLSIYNIRSGNYIRKDIDPSNRNLNIHALLSEYEDIWLGTFGNGLYRLDQNLHIKRHYTQADVDTGDMNVYSAFRDKSRGLWIGTKRGIAFYDKDNDCFTRALELEDNSDVTDIVEFGGDLWFASQGRGLIHYDTSSKNFEIIQQTDESMPKSITCLQVYDDLLYFGGDEVLATIDNTGKIVFMDGALRKNERVQGMVADNSGLWITTNQGLICFENSTSALYYDSYDGLMNNQFTQKSILRLSNGRILVGTNGGMNSFRPAELKNSQIHRPLKVAITEFAEIAQNGLRVALPISERIVLRRDIYSFAIDFSAINYQSRNKVVYKYRLNGYESKWNTVSSDELVNGLIYGDVSPGLYTFEVMAAPTGKDAFGESSSIHIEVRSSVKAQIKKTLLYSLIIGLILALVYSLLTNLTFKAMRSQSIGLMLGTGMRISDGTRKSGTVESSKRQSPLSKSSIELRTILLLGGGKNADDKFISGVCAFVSENISNSALSVEDIAQEMNVSRATVFNKIKSNLDTTPNQMIKLMRLERAADELCKYNVRVSDVYDSVGFVSASYFTKLFHKEFGVTPKDFSKKYKDGQTWRKDIFSL